ncbi:Apoptosis-associated speck-like protein containing a CARD [Merluccius polli]|uniref:Apoptosis-associated speck-like protein containing a CARD n=1 Tax=Merluccius polli TaxID=89951 RepID=A0AA47NVQ1_MERPO|nr:Apoptosis-associated speck-like protein containing a CARD [Merluccius polli]
MTLQLWETETAVLLNAELNRDSIEEHFVDRHRSSLIQRISLMEPVLDQLLDHEVVRQEQYDTILTKEPRQNQVRELYRGALRSSGTRGKDIFLSVLEKTDHLLIEDLRGQVSPEEHFVDRHRSSLVQRISLVAAILDQLLDHKVVSQEQYDTILAKATRQDQVRELYSGPLRSSGTRGKDIFLCVLEELEPFLIEDLRGKLSPEEHFVDRHRSSLIQRISLVAALLDQLLDHKVVSQEQYDTILAKATRQNQVRELYSGALRSSGTRGKDISLSVLEETDHLLIEDLRGQRRRNEFETLSYRVQRELERQPFIPPTLPMELSQTLHLSDVGLACQANLDLVHAAINAMPFRCRGQQLRFFFFYPRKPVLPAHLR